MTTTLWLTGLPSSGKSTLAAALTATLRDRRRVEHLDGDAVRAGLFPELGFGRADRTENVRRIGELAAMLAGHGVLAVVSAIAPYRDARDRVRAEHEMRGLTFLEVHVDADPEVCAERDVKGLYARARAGELDGLTGVGDVYEAPFAPELRLPTAHLPVAECVRLVDDLIARSDAHDAGSAATDGRTDRGADIR